MNSAATGWAPAATHCVRSAAAGAVILASAACGDSRNDAADDLTRLGSEMSAHAAAYGQLPRTLQPASPEDASNLPFNPDHGVQVRLQSVADSQYLAVAFKRSWRCWIIGTRDRHSEPDCAPASGAPVSDAAGDSSQTRLPLQAVDSTRSH